MESTHTQTVLATHGFSSPEQALGRKNTGPWSDIYSLGATFYSLLRGGAPPRGEERLIHDTIQPLELSAPLSSHYSKNFLRTIDKALSPRVEDRYNSAEEWMKDLGVEGGALSTIKFSSEEFKSARKRFFNLFAFCSLPASCQEGAKSGEADGGKVLGLFVVAGVIGRNPRLFCL